MTDFNKRLKDIANQVEKLSADLAAAGEGRAHA